MTQLRRHSLLESCLNTTSGFLVSYLAWPVVCRFVLHVPFRAGAGLEAITIFTVLSVARNYLWRRAFNRRPYRMKASEEASLTQAFAHGRIEGGGYRPGARRRRIATATEETMTQSAPPRRIQLRRTKGWRMPPNTVKVDRSTRWGNPFPVSQYGLGPSLQMFADAARGIWSPCEVQASLSDEQVVSAYEAQRAWRDRLAGHPIDAIRRELRGKNLACWCPPDRPCHADVLLEIANG